MSHHITARIWTPADGEKLSAVDYPELGELFVDPIRKRFGIFNSGDYVDWYPSLNDLFLNLNKGQKLGGATAGGGLNNLYLDYSVPDEIQIRQRGVVDPVFRFTTAGGVYGFVNSPGVRQYGLVNQLINAGLSITRSFENTKNVNKRLLAPNWQVWANRTAAGPLLAELSPLAPPGAASSVSIGIDTRNPPNRAGVRSCVLDLRPFAGRKVNLSCWHLGQTGDRASARALNNFHLFGSIDFTGTGVWTRQNFAITVPSLARLALEDRFLVFDSLYNPYLPSGQRWLVGAPQVTLGEQPIDFEIRDHSLDSMLARRLYREQRVLLNAGVAQLLDFDLDEQAVGLVIEDRVGAAHTYTISAADRAGAVIRAPQAPQIIEPFEAMVAAYTMPILAESTE